jgi:NADH:ubiquinone oxidoreductase subunit
MIRSYSWSSNICGVKRWTLFPPGQEHLFKDRFGNTVYDIRDVDESKFPRFAEAKRIVIFQVDGTTLFVPSGWWHQVENIGATISINHNWGNACNLHIMNESLENDLADVRHTISDVKEMMDSLEYEQTCQHILLVNSGWNWETLWGMLTCIAERLLQELKGSNLVTYQPPISYSLQVIRQVTEKWRTCKEKRRVFEAAENQDIETLNRVLEIAQEQLESSSRDTLN